MDLINKLRNLLTKRDKQFLLLLLFFSIVISIIETVGISAIMPFISVASDFTLIETNSYYNYFYELLSFTSSVNFVIAFGSILILFYILRSIINLLYFHLLARFSQGRYHLLAFRLFRNYLGFSYRDFINKNSSYLTKSIVNEANNLTSLISAILFMFSEVFIVILIYSMLLFVNWKITLILTGVLFFKAIIILKTITKRIKRAGAKRETHQQQFYEIINSSFGNFKLIKLLSNEKEILNRFREASFGFANSNITHISLIHFPRLLLEGIGFSIMVFVVVYLVYKYNTDVKAAIPIISMYVLALYRLMPSVNRIMYSYNEISFYRSSLNVIHSDLMYSIEELGDKKIEFKNKIVLKNVNFAFNENEYILKGLNLTIQKGEKIAFIGDSGSGKSTLVDIVIGLYRAKSGDIFIDNTKLDDSNIKEWRRKVGYIPQSVYLFDGTIAQNVVFNREYDEVKVIEVLKQASIWEFLQTKDGFETMVGENGVKLSGGQKQRIAIARALYGDPEILVLDEATSALDTNTENIIMDEIYRVSEDKTLILIAHRLSTLKGCNKIYRVIDNRVVEENRDINELNNTQL